MVSVQNNETCIKNIGRIIAIVLVLSFLSFPKAEHKDFSNIVRINCSNTYFYYHKLFKSFYAGISNSIQILSESHDWRFRIEIIPYPITLNLMYRFDLLKFEHEINLGIFSYNERVRYKMDFDFISKYKVLLTENVFFHVGGSIIDIDCDVDFGNLKSRLTPVFYADIEIAFTMF